MQAALQGQAASAICPRPLQLTYGYRQTAAIAAGTTSAAAAAAPPLAAYNHAAVTAAGRALPCWHRPLPCHAAAAPPAEYEPQDYASSVITKEEVEARGSGTREA